MSHHEGKQAQDKHIEDLPLYIGGLEGLYPDEKYFILIVARQHHKKKNWTARGIELARIFSRSRSTITRRLKRITGRNGWIERDRR